MNYEEAYKEAIERCKSWMRGEHPECFTEAQKAGEYIFPELRESEDERIRKELISLVDSMSASKKRDRLLIWLEKQGEQKSWSEEDEERLQDVIYWFEIFCDKNKTKPEMKESLDWLKSIKPNHWKPSEEQMKGI